MSTPAKRAPAWIAAPVIGGVALSLGSPVRADSEWGATAAVGVGATDNVMSTTGSAAIPDGFVRTDLGGSFRLRTARSENRLAYTAGMSAYVQRTQAVSLRHELGWLGTVTPSRDTDLGFTLGGAQGRLSDFDLFRQGLGSAARPAGAQTFAAFSASEHFGWMFSRDWGLGQGVSGSAFFPMGDDQGLARTWNGDAVLSIARVWLRDRASFVVRAGTGHTGAIVLPPMEPLPARRANIGEAGLRLDHTFSPAWSASVAAGALGVQVPGGRDPFISGGGNASVTYHTRTRGDVTVHGERGVYSNVYLGDVLLQTSGGVLVSHPFGQWQAWRIAGGVDYQRARSVFVVQVNQGKVEVLAAKATLAYDNGSLLRFLVEASFTNQDVGATSRGTMSFPPFTLRRTVVMATMEVRYPPPPPEAGAAAGGGRSGGRRRGSLATPDTGDAAGGDPVDPAAEQTTDGPEPEGDAPTTP